MAIINTIQQVNDTLEALTKSIDFTVGTFSKKMSSDEANSIFSRFGAIINSLYEKARHLQDLREYTESCVEKQYSSKYKKLKAITDSIENTESQYQKDKQVTHDVLLTSNSDHSSLLDFDGSTISNAFITSSNIITSGYNEIYSYSLTQNKDIKCISDKDGVFSCSIDFDAQKDKANINYLEISTPNCTVNAVEVENASKEKHVIDPSTASFMDAQSVNMVTVNVEMASGRSTTKSTDEINNSTFA